MSEEQKAATRKHCWSLLTTTGDSSRSAHKYNVKWAAKSGISYVRWKFMLEKAITRVQPFNANLFEAMMVWKSIIWQNALQMTSPASHFFDFCGNYWQGWAIGALLTWTCDWALFQWVHPGKCSCWGPIKTLHETKVCWRTLLRVAHKTVHKELSCFWN